MKEGCQSACFQYIRLETGTRRFLCLQQNIGVLIWILLFKKDTIRTKRPIRASLRWMEYLTWHIKGQALIHLLKNKFIPLVKFIAYKYQWRISKSIITLPVYGQICVPVHKGYKVFDLRRAVVMKLFDPDIEIDDISNEIEQLKIVSRVSFAPTLRNWDLSKRWYEEDYFNGKMEASGVPNNSEEFLKKFHQDFVPYAIDLMLFQSPHVKNCEPYLRDLIRVLEASKVGKLAGQDVGVEKVKDFFGGIVACLHSKGDIPLFHVYTHGDFCPENMLKTQKGMKIIDWESAKYRTALFDFYSYFFYRPVQKNVPIKLLIVEIHEALPFLITKIFKELPELAKSISKFESLYRKIYYLERIGMLAERTKTDKNLDILDVIFRYIEAFERYEQMLLSTDVGANVC